MTNLIKKKERNDGFAESNASPPCVGHAFMNAKPDPDESFESCNDCGDSLNLGQRILNSKRVEGSKLCGRCHGRERKAWMNGEFDAHDGKKYEGKQRILTQSERREREREKLKHKKETNHVMFSRVLGRHVPINEYDNEIRKHWIENEHVVKSNALKRDVPINVYGKLRKRVEKERILRMMQAHQSMNHSSCANSGCDCHVSPKWFTLSDMKNELILRCELAGITRTEEQFRRKLERMFTPVVSTAMKENEEMYFCLECKEKEFFKVGKRLQRVDEK